MKPITRPFDVGGLRAAMGGEKIERRVTITNPQGFHMRPATKFAQLANQFQSSVVVYKGDQRINGKSPLDLMLRGRTRARS